MQKGQWINNVKSQNSGRVVSAYNRTSDGVAMVEVVTVMGLRAYWKASHCEVA